VGVRAGDAQHRHAQTRTASPLPDRQGDADDALTDALEELAGHSLASFAQHSAVLQHEGLVASLVQLLRLAAAAPDGESLPAWAEAAVLAAQSLTITAGGRQALLEAGALAAACKSLAECNSTAKRRKLSSEACATTHTGRAADGALSPGHREFAAEAVQLLASLLCEPSPARPAVGGLGCCDLAAAAAVAAAVLEVRCVLLQSWGTACLEPECRDLCWCRLCINAGRTATRSIQ
jgi:hypothetical protein